MKIAVYSDIHGNTPGLEAVTEAIDRAGDIDLEICLGDVVYGGPGTTEILDLLSDRRVLLLRGNHDEDLPVFNSILDTLPQHTRENAKLWNNWLLDRLSEEQVHSVSTAPLLYSTRLPDRSRLLFCHAHPGNIALETLGPGHSDVDRERYFGDLAYEYVVIGHWHEPALFRGKKTDVYCPGSVGMRSDGTAHWMLINASGGKASFSFRTERYSISQFYDLAHQVGMPPTEQPKRIVGRGPRSAETPPRTAPPGTSLRPV